MLVNQEGSGKALGVLLHAKEGGSPQEGLSQLCFLYPRHEPWCWYVVIANRVF